MNHRNLLLSGTFLVMLGLATAVMAFFFVGFAMIVCALIREFLDKPEPEDVSEGFRLIISR